MRRFLIGLATLSLSYANTAHTAEWPYFESRVEVAACDINEDTIWVWSPAQHRDQVATLINDWQAHPLASLSQCLQQRTYVEQTDLQCTTLGEREHQRCKLPLLPREVMQRHIVFTDVKTASTSPLQMVLPSNADVELFAHEMAHWLGFADEYPMSQSLATHFCRGRYQHPALNIVLTDRQLLSAAELQRLWRSLPWQHAVEDWRLLGTQQTNGKWRLGSNTQQAVGLFASRTCAAIDGIYSWKPVARMTAMEYHDVNYWPAVYLAMVRDLQRRRRLRDHDNRAK